MVQLLVDLVHLLRIRPEKNSGERRAAPARLVDGGGDGEGAGRVGDGGAEPVRAGSGRGGGRRASTVAPVRKRRR